MAELAEMGYLKQPHTSSGRIPSDLGYRFYVDRLMDSHKINPKEQEHAKNKLPHLQEEIDNILDKSCRILADLAKYTAVATQPSIKATKVNLVNVSDVAKDKFLVVVVLDNGRIVHGFVDDCNLRSDKATNFLISTILNHTINEISYMITSDEMYKKLFEIIKKLLSEELEADVHLHGTGYIIKQPEFRDTEKLGEMMNILEDKKTLAKLLHKAFANNSLTVIIGSENPTPQMHNCSFVGMQYTMNSRPVGSIGVIAPTRMNYKKAVASVKFMSANLTALLEQLGIG